MWPADLGITCNKCVSPVLSPQYHKGSCCGCCLIQRKGDVSGCSRAVWHARQKRHAIPFWDTRIHSALYIHVLFRRDCMDHASPAM